ncbi:hypothetical protein BRADI_3g42461v3 [Brachypodium distachyon]|uniref:Uncharacterized protein n=1 Tax=Brachypodium distachyon TaxID=15368 RepID=A0A0Q3QC19_BRADI|nr:hypothetical protein BRADI_3g42461v3 [Brachypodium distachyon]
MNQELTVLEYGVRLRSWATEDLYECLTLCHVPPIGSKASALLPRIVVDLEGTRAPGIYELRTFRRETLFWINLLYRSSTPLSRSPIRHSSARNRSSSHTTLLFWDVVDTRNHLGISICFDKRPDVDSSSETVTSLASASSITTLLSLSETVFLLIFLNCFCAFLASRMYAFT